jgi:type I restriction enzyme S subunit
VNWPIARLDACTSIVSGATPKTSDASHWNGDVCWATPKDLSDLDGKYIGSTPRKLTRSGLASCSANILPPLSVLFSSRAPIGHVAINTVPMATNQGFKSFVPHRERLDANFLYHWLRANRAYLESLGNGATFKEVSKAVVSRVMIPLPPLAEQRRIAAILDKADELRAKRRAALAHLDTLTQSIFLDMFGNGSDRRWTRAPVAEYVERFEGGKSIEAEPNSESQTQNRVLKISAVTGCVFLPSESKPAPESYVPPAQHFVRAGDLLFSRANTTELVGAVAYVDASPKNLLLPDKLWRFVWREPQRAEPLFVWSLFQTRSVREAIGRRATGTSGSMKNISQEKLLAMSTILPPMALQREFGRRLLHTRSLQLDFRRALSLLDAGFTSLQHRAFRGEL